MKLQLCLGMPMKIHTFSFTHRKQQTCSAFRRYCMEKLFSNKAYCGQGNYSRKMITDGTMSPGSTQNQRSNLVARPKAERNHHLDKSQAWSSREALDWLTATVTPRKTLKLMSYSLPPPPPIPTASCTVACVMRRERMRIWYLTYLGALDNHLGLLRGQATLP